MQNVQVLLSQVFPGEEWHISTPAAGLKKESYIAESKQRKVFVKFDTHTPAWSRLSTIGVTPTVLAQGDLDGRAYLIQEFVEGQSPDRTWFAENSVQLARLIRRYQTDDQLQALLASSQSHSYVAHTQWEVKSLEDALASTSAELFTGTQFKENFKRFREQANDLRVVSLVPIHADPSATNCG